ncbi:MAG: DUF1987 domain-containing protein [Bernardetiaceae bacterium]
MKNFYVKGDKFIPEIRFIEDDDILEISGQSYHEHTEEFFTPAFEWLREYFKRPGRQVTFNFRMSYFNTASSRCFLDILEMLEEYEKTKEGKVTINWYYRANDFDMLESGEDFALDVELDFHLIPM